MRLTSPLFVHGGAIPEQCTCDGADKSPELRIEAVPESALSLVLIVDDPDVPEFIRLDRMWVHWVVFNIPPGFRLFGQGCTPPGIPGKGTGGQLFYQGPCPPDREHRYFFKLYALDVELDLPSGATKAEVEAAMEGHILEQAELMGRYNRPANR